MKISSGMAEIGFMNSLNNRIGTEKFYVWPRYNAGRVEDIHNVTRRTDPNLAYLKPSAEEHDRLFSLMNDNSQVEYSRAGTINRSSVYIRPGSFFDAIA